MAKETNNKLENLWNDVSKNENDIANIKRIVANSINYSTIRKTQVITVLDNYKLDTQIQSPTKLIWGFYDIEVIVPFDNMPTWALSGVSNIILFSGSESQVINTSDQFFYRVFSQWQFRDNKYIYRTYIRFGWFDDSVDEYVPVYVDFDILIQNPRKYINQQGYKS